MYGVQSENNFPIPALGFDATRNQGRSPLIRIVKKREYLGPNPDCLIASQGH
jgi:hypothetical protein